MSEATSETKTIAKGTVIIDLTVILKDVLPPIYHLPQGGSVSAAGMVPLLWHAHAGWKAYFFVEGESEEKEANKAWARS